MEVDRGLGFLLWGRGKGGENAMGVGNGSSEERDAGYLKSLEKERDRGLKLLLLAFSVLDSRSRSLRPEIRVVSALSDVTLHANN